MFILIVIKNTTIVQEEDPTIPILLKIYRISSANGVTRNTAKKLCCLDPDYTFFSDGGLLLHHFVVEENTVKLASPSVYFFAEVPKSLEISVTDEECVVL